MRIRWLTAVLDLPAEGFDEAGSFWATITDTTRGAIHPQHPEFVHLNPTSGAMHLELQRLDSGPARVHLDLLTDDIAGLAAKAESLGATVLARPGHVVLVTPGGVPFCIVPWTDETDRAPLIDRDPAHAADQICLDVPAESFDDDVVFWSALTGWDVNPYRFEQFRSFAQPAELPLRLLVQRLDPTDAGPGRAHLDFAAGADVDAVVDRHVQSGAAVVERGPHWTVLADPIGMRYCVTARPVPASGT